MEKFHLNLEWNISRQCVKIIIWLVLPLSGNKSIWERKANLLTLFYFKYHSLKIFKTHTRNMLCMKVTKFHNSFHIIVSKEQMEVNGESIKWNWVCPSSCTWPPLAPMCAKGTQLYHQEHPIADSSHGALCILCPGLSLSQILTWVISYYQYTTKVKTILKNKMWERPIPILQLL